MSNNISEVKQIAKQIAEQLDRLDGINNRIDAATWKKYAVSSFGAKDNVSIFIDKLSAEECIESYLAKEAAKTGEKVSDIGAKWNNILLADNNAEKEELQIENSASPEKDIQESPISSESAFSNQIVFEKDEIFNYKEKPVSTRVEKPVIVENKPVKNKREIDNAIKNKIIHNMYAKWSTKYNGSNLGINFYSKLYDFIELINCEVEDKNFNSDKYSSKREQTIDEVIAILAGESSLSSRASHSIYRGIFQLDADSLSTIKKVAKQNNIKGVSQNITFSQFAKLSGEQQLDYLVGHVAFAKGRSGITNDEKISPEQLWAMIKLPNKGQKDSALTQQKLIEINKVFEKNNIERGIM